MSRYRLFAAMWALVAGITVAGFFLPDSDAVQQDRNVPSGITEDMPGWNCKTMGNRICGPDAPAPGTVQR